MAKYEEWRDTDTVEMATWFLDSPGAAHIADASEGENAWHCWISDKKGRSIASLFKQLNLPKEKFEQLSRVIESTKYRNVTSTETKTESIQLPAEYKPLWIPKNTPDYRNAMHYLKNRNVTIFDILKYRIGYCDAGEYSGKIIIPSYDCNGQLNYFVSRAFYKADQQKHKNPKISKDIIGFDLTINWSQPIILCEGSFDAIAIKRNAIPLFGKIITGNSTKMKTLAVSALKKHKFDYQLMGDGSILVSGTI